jgi:hypothetical protein
VSDRPQSNGFVDKAGGHPHFPAPFEGAQHLRMNLVVVESPAKAKTINKYLGPDFTVLASYGHVRDLPSKDGSVLPDDDFAMSWEVDARASKRMSEIAEAVKKADRVILATDPDREGEAISWHVLEILTKKKALKDKAVERVTFNAITKSAVLEAMANPRQLDMELVEAYLARRALDYLVGFTLSPVLWRKLPVRRSAGRVQSVALRIVVDREMEIEAFRAAGILVRRGRSGRRQPALHHPAGQTRRQAGAATSTSPPRPWLRPRATPSKPEPSPSSIEKKPVKRSSLAALHHLDPAAGGRAQAGLHRPADHAGGAETV